MSTPPRRAALGVTLAALAASLALPAVAGATVPGGNGSIVFTSYNRSGLANTELYARSPAGALTDISNTPTYTETDPAVSPDGTQVAFASNRDADHDLELYVMPVGGGAAVQLTRNAVADQQPTWSPDGKRIAFESYRDGHAEIYVMNADGSGQTRITASAATNSVQPAWSPDGTTIAYVTTHPPFSTGIWLTNPDGTNQRFLANTLIIDAYPDWSPDSSHIAVSFSGDVWSIPLGGGPVVNLTAHQGTAVAPSWSPDGRQIAFFTSRTGNDELFSVDLASGVQANLTHDVTAPLADDRYPAWVPAGPLQAIAVTDAGCPAKVSVKLGNRVQWNLANTLPRTVHDDSGMGLYDAGSRTAPFTQWASFGAAGTYRYHCGVDGSLPATISVTPTVKPATGTTATSFTLTYASTPAPAGFVYDVQIERPGSTSFADWAIGATAPTARFTPDAGAGTYAFQARLRRIAGGAAAYSPAKTITAG